MTGRGSRPVRKTCMVGLDYAAMATGKNSPGKEKSNINKPSGSNNKGKSKNKQLGETKHRRKASTPKRLVASNKGHKKRGKQGVPAFLNSTNGRWSITPCAGDLITHEMINDIEHDDHDELLSESFAVSEDGEVVDLHPEENNEFVEEPELAKAINLRVEIAKMRKQLEAKKLRTLRKKKARLQKELDMDSDGSEVDETSKEPTLTHKSKKHKSAEKGKVDKLVTDSDWEGLMSASKISEEWGSKSSDTRNNLPPFDKLKAMFVDEVGGNKKKKTQFCEVRLQGSEEDGGKSGGDDCSEGSPPVSNRNKGKSNPTSGFFARASDTKIIKQVVHAHAMLDIDETNGQDMSLNELPFHLLVAGEMEIVLGNCSAEEKWTHLNLLRQLSYKVQYLSQATVIERYAGFLHKVEKGKFRWGEENAIRELEETLRLRVFPAGKTTGAKGGSFTGNQGEWRQDRGW